jgi:hypothetical protein
MRTIRIALVLSALLAAQSGCTSTDEAGNTEPVAPESEPNTGYPEDPDLGAPSGEEQSSVQEPATPEEDTPGELTDDPYGAPSDKQNSDSASDIMTEPEKANPDTTNPVTGDDLTGSFEDPQPEYEPSEAPTGDTFTEPVTDDAGTASQGKTTRYVRAILLNVRSRPNYRSPIVRRLYGGAKVQVEIHGTYAKLRDGQWVHTRYLSSKPTKKATAKDVEAAWKKSKYKDNWKPGK